MEPINPSVQFGAATPTDAMKSARESLKRTKREQRASQKTYIRNADKASRLSYRYAAAEGDLKRATSRSHMLEGQAKRFKSDGGNGTSSQTSTIPDAAKAVKKIHDNAVGILTETVKTSKATIAKIQKPLAEAQHKAAESLAKYTAATQSYEDAREARIEAHTDKWVEERIGIAAKLLKSTDPAEQRRGLAMVKHHVSRLRAAKKGEVHPLSPYRDQTNNMEALLEGITGNGGRLPLKDSLLTNIGEEADNLLQHLRNTISAEDIKAARKAVAKAKKEGALKKGQGPTKVASATVGNVTGNNATNTADDPTVVSPAIAVVNNGGGTTVVSTPITTLNNGGGTTVVSTPIPTLNNGGGTTVVSTPIPTLNNGGGTTVVSTNGPTNNNAVGTTVVSTAIPVVNNAGGTTVVSTNDTVAVANPVTDNTTGINAGETTDTRPQPYRPKRTYGARELVRAIIPDAWKGYLPRFVQRYIGPQTGASNQPTVQTTQVQNNGAGNTGQSNTAAVDTNINDGNNQGTTATANRHPVSFVTTTTQNQDSRQNDGANGQTVEAMDALISGDRTVFVIPNGSHNGTSPIIVSADSTGLANPLGQQTVTMTTGAPFVPAFSMQSNTMLAGTTGTGEDKTRTKDPAPKKAAVKPKKDWTPQDVREKLGQLESDSVQHHDKPIDTDRPTVQNIYQNLTAIASGKEKHPLIGKEDAAAILADNDNKRLFAIYGHTSNGGGDTDASEKKS